MAGVLGWGWYPTGGIWLPLVVNDAGKLEIAGVEDAEIRQDTPEDMQHLPHGYYAGGPSYLPFMVDSEGRLIIAVVPWTGEGARVYNSAAIEIANTTETTLTFDSERWDTDTIHSTTANTDRLTCKTAGKYLVNGQVFFEGNATGFRYVKIKHSVDGSIATQYHSIVGAAEVGIIVTTIADLAVNEYVYLRVYQTSGGALDVLLIAQLSLEFMMQRIG